MGRSISMGIKGARLYLKAVTVIVNSPVYKNVVLRRSISLVKKRSIAFLKAPKTLLSASYSSSASAEPLARNG